MPDIHGAAAEIFRSVKQAREYAVLGRYPTALVFLGELSKQIDVQIQCSAADVQELWQVVKEDIQRESELIRQLRDELASFVSNPSHAGVNYTPAPAPSVNNFGPPSGAPPPNFGNDTPVYIGGRGRQWDDRPIGGVAGKPERYEHSGERNEAHY
eukprot:Sspe_Gene.100804::Locus_75458_Transcript_1_1_Confidence_1.000_Length_514::g.100804::m.100804